MRLVSAACFSGRRMSRGAAMSVVALLLATCGGSNGDGVDIAGGDGSSTTTVVGQTTGEVSVPRTAVESSTTLGAVTTTTGRGSTTTGMSPRSSTTTTTQSALSRRDVPPGVVPAQFPATPPTTVGPCRVSPESTPTIRSAGSVEIGRTMEVCFPGFAANTPVDVVVTPPAGPARNLRAASYSAYPYLNLYAVPGDPVGVYTLIARQGTRNAGTTFTVTRATSRHFLVLPPASGPAGTVFRFALSGFAPDTSVLLSLYAGSLGVAPKYLTELGPATIDRDGQSIVELPSRRGDPPGPYCIAYRATANEAPPACAGFFEVSP